MDNKRFNRWHDAIWNFSQSRSFNQETTTYESNQVIFEFAQQDNCCLTKRVVCSSNESDGEQTQKREHEREENMKRREGRRRSYCSLCPTDERTCAADDRGSHGQNLRGDGVGWLCTA